MTKLDKKIEETIRTNTLAIICPKCHGGGYDYDEKKNCEECNGDGLTEWRYGHSAKEIKKVVREEIIKKMPKEVKVPKAGMYKEDELDDYIKFVVAYNNALVDVKSVIKDILD